MFDVQQQHIFSNGADLAVVQRMLGHKQLATTVIYDRRGEKAEKDGGVDDYVVMFGCGISVRIFFGDSYEHSSSSKSHGINQIAVGSDVLAFHMSDITRLHLKRFTDGVQQLQSSGINTFWAEFRSHAFSQFRKPDNTIPTSNRATALGWHHSARRT